MGSDKKYRWEKRRDEKSRIYKSFRLDFHDWVMLTLICVMYFISLRLFFIFEVTSAPCAEMIMTMGESSGLPPIFKLTFWISLLIGVYWFCVTVQRILLRQANWTIILWHLILLLSIFFLAISNLNLTASSYVKAPDGIMVVENMTPVKNNSEITWQSPEKISWAEYKNGKWYAHGFQACIWLDENKVSYNDRFDLKRPENIAQKFMFEGRSLEILKDIQTYRPLSDWERESFLQIKACQADITKYGQHRSVCTSTYLYAIEPGLKPSPEWLDKTAE